MKHSSITLIPPSSYSSLHGFSSLPTSSPSLFCLCLLKQISVSATTEPQQEEVNENEKTLLGRWENWSIGHLHWTIQLVSDRICTQRILRHFLSSALYSSMICHLLRMPHCEHLLSPLIFLYNFGMGNLSLSDSVLSLGKWGWYQHLHCGSWGGPIGHCNVVFCWREIDAGDTFLLCSAITSTIPTGYLELLF